MKGEEILEKLSKEERLELLERLIQGAMQAQEEDLSTEERIERLEALAGWGPRRQHLGGHGFRGPGRRCGCC